MKAIVKNDACIGCSACAAIEPEVFEINDNGIAEVKVSTIADDKQESTKEAADSCPTGAIEIAE